MTKTYYMHYCFIANGREDKLHVANEIKAEIEALKEKPDYELYLTKAPGDATRFVKEIVKARKDEEICFVACGGDGSIKEVASGIVKAKDKYLAVLAKGTGNDFIKYYPGKNFTSVEALLAGKPEKIDILKIGNQYSINVTNFGFDSVVGSTANKMAAKGKKDPYRIGIVTAILKGRFNNIVVKADGEQLNKKKMLLCTLANCNFVGGEFKCAPKAKNNDGLIDVCLLKTMSLFRFLKILPVYTAGNHLDDPKFAKDIVYRQAKTVEIDAPKEIELCLDGEMLPGTHFEVSILPRAVQIIIPD